MAKPTKQVIRYDLSHQKGTSCKSFAMRETNGLDEEQAAQSAKMRGGNVTTAEELVRLAIVEVDGKPVKQPFLEFEAWNTKTRALALAAWSAINVVPSADMDSFLAGGEMVDAGALLPPSERDAGSDDDIDEDGLE